MAPRKQQPQQPKATVTLWFYNGDDNPRWILDVDVPGQRGTSRSCRTSPAPLIKWVEKWAEDRGLSLSMWGATIHAKQERSE